MMRRGWEQEAVVRTREGQPDAYAALVDRFDRPIHHAVFRIVGDHDRADDITQQAFVSAYENLAGFDLRHRFFSWIYRIAVNEALNAKRDGRRRCRLDDLELQAPGPSPEERLIARERAERVGRVLDVLPAKYRILVTLRYDRGCHYGEIARIVGLPATTVKSRLHTALELLRREWRRTDAAGGAERPADRKRRRSRPLLARSA